MKGIVNYTRWKYTVSLKEWLQACKISKQKLYSMLTEIIDAEVPKVIIGEAYTTRYEVYTSTGFHCYVAFEKIHKEQQMFWIKAFCVSERSPFLYLSKLTCVGTEDVVGTSNKISIIPSLSTSKTSILL